MLTCLRIQSELFPSAWPVEEPSKDQSLKSWGFIDVMGFCACPPHPSQLSGCCVCFPGSGPSASHNVQGDLLEVPELTAQTAAGVCLAGAMQTDHAAPAIILVQAAAMLYFRRAGQAHLDDLGLRPHLVEHKTLQAAACTEASCIHCELGCRVVW